MGINYSVLLAYIIGIIILFILGRMFLVPMKIVLKLIFNGIIGGIVIFFINLAGSLFDFHIPLNAASSLIVGFLGIPGLILLIILKALFKA